MQPTSSPAGSAPWVWLWRVGWWPKAPATWFSWAGAAVSLGLLADWQRQGVLRHPVDLARRLAGHLGLPEPVGSVLSVPVQVPNLSASRPRRCSMLT